MPRLHYLLGTTLGFAGRYADAQAALRQALTLNPDYGDATLALARVTSWQGHHDTALALMRPFLTTHPSNLEALLLTGRLHYFLTQYDLALFYFGQALELDAEAIDALIGQGDVFLAQEQYAEAERAYAPCGPARPHHPRSATEAPPQSRLRRPAGASISMLRERSLKRSGMIGITRRFRPRMPLTPGPRPGFAMSFFERFKDVGHLYQLGGSHQFTDWFWARAAVSLSGPRAAYLAKDAYQLGATLRLWPGPAAPQGLLGATYLTLEQYVSRFARNGIGTIYRLDPGVQQYVLDDRAWAHVSCCQCLGSQEWVV